eukprot:GEMP01033396.1.p1 GENE.GEMP01033396.1~~GEMP01033396.1.p1  ORF type:complete len:452 (-),score=81.21 GEMP01033396.1:762-2087(-)
MYSKTACTQRGLMLQLLNVRHFRANQFLRTGQRRHQHAAAHSVTGVTNSEEPVGAQTWKRSRDIVDLGSSPAEWTDKEKSAYFLKSMNMDEISIEQTEQYFVHMTESNITPDVLAYTSMITACMKRGLFDRAERWWHRMKEMNVAPNEFTYGAMITMGGKAGDVDMIETYLGESLSTGAAPSDEMFSILISSFAKAKATDRAVHWFREAAHMIGARILPCHLQGALKAICNDEQASASTAEELVEIMRKNGVKLDNFCRAYMMRIWATERNGEMVEKWLHTECTEEPDFHAFAIAVAGIAKLGDLDKAATIALDMEAKMGPNGVVCNSIITAAGNQGKYDIAKEWAARRLAAKFQPDGYTYFGLLLGAYNTGNVVDAIHILESMPEPSVKHLSVVVSTLIKSRDPRAVEYERRLTAAGGKLSKRMQFMMDDIRANLHSAGN